MTQVVKQKLRCVSRPYWRRVAFLPLNLAVIFLWTVVLAGVALAVSALSRAHWQVVLLLLGALIFAAYLALFSWRWMQDSKLEYEFSAEGDMLCLSSYNHRTKNARVQCLSLAEVITAEFFEPCDSTSLLLRGRTSSLDVPLWSFEPEAAQAIMEYVRDRGIKMVNIPGR